ncbi:electron transport complex protein RnfC [Marinomonas sp. MED121]|uniref:electron transport complex subunit RsxC n=1 Tax=Marinomonas sp. MED121 TaxID=314277 RepID=UPI00006911B6|nr:electron transport complex subunit RsxC [Marinomonas sp. MED121]EAQ67285.1 electron transport complex protein RnfC [Marinomonas sp. MED121]
MSLSQAEYQIHGGIHPPENKTQSLQLPLGRPTLPERLILPLGQHIGQASRPLVKVGDKVLKGQAIAINNGFLSSFLHAPTSGEILAIDLHGVPHPSGLEEVCIQLQPDGLDLWTELNTLENWLELPTADVVSHLAEMGIVGMGGAGFPTQVKLAGATKHTIHELIINAAECEPYITADDMLIREKTDALIKGIQVLQTLIEAQRTIIGIEDNKQTAIKLLTDEIERTKANIDVVVLPTKYPSGGEKQLIQLITGKEVPSGQLPADIGVMCQNVGTCVAIYDAIYQGKPLISRITTLTGDAMGQAQNVEVLLGTPISHLLEYAEFNPQHLERLVMGGPMMGFTISDNQVPVVKTSNCILAASTKELPTPAPEQACIRCGMCEQACPASLLPQQLLWFSKSQEHEKAEHHNLFDCIECGACSYVCPSSIPLVQYYRHTKSAIRESREAAVKSDHAKVRFEARQARIAAEAAEKEAKRAAARAKAAASAAKKAADLSATNDAKTRAQIKEEPKTEIKDDNQAQVKKLKIDIAIANTKLKKTTKQLTLAQEAADLEQINTLTQAQKEQQAIVSELEQALAKLDQAAPAKTASAKPAANDATKKAKVDLAIASTKLKKLQKQLSLDEANTEIAQQISEQETVVKTAQAALDKANKETPQAPPAANASTGMSADLKKAKIDLAIASTKLKKLEKQLAADESNEDLKAQLKEQKTLVEKAQAAFDTLNADTKDVATPASKPKIQVNSDDLKKAKIDLAMASTKLKKLHKQLAQTPESDDIKAQITQQEAAQADAQARLDKLNNANDATPISKARVAPIPASDEVKKAKIAFAMASTKLKKAQKKLAEDSDNQALKDQVETLQKETAEAQSALDAITQAPTPELAPETKNEADVDTQAKDNANQAVEASPNISKDELKKAKIALVMASTKLKKVQKKLEEEPENQDLIDQVKMLEAQHEKAQSSFDALNVSNAKPQTEQSVVTPPVSTETKSSDEEPKTILSDVEIKKLKIEAAMAKASAAKIEKAVKRAQELALDELADLTNQHQASLARAEQLAANLKAAISGEKVTQTIEESPKPEPKVSSASDSNKSLKIEHAMAKAALNKVLLSIRRMQDDGASEADIAATDLPQEKAEKERQLAQVESQMDQEDTLKAEQERLAKRGPLTKPVPTAKPKPDDLLPELPSFEHLDESGRAAESKKQKIAAAMAKAKLMKLQIRLEKEPDEAKSIRITMDEVRIEQKQAQRILAKLNDLSVQEKD